MSRLNTRRSSASFVLERAQSQLLGKRVTEKKGDDEGDLGAYLNTLALRTSTQKATVLKADVEISDLSMSSNDAIMQPTYSAEASRFLKKKKTTDTPIVRKTSPTTVKKNTSRSVSGKSATFGNSSALNKAAALGKKFDNKQKVKGHKTQHAHVGKENNVDISDEDHDIGKGGSRFLKKKPKVNERSPTLGRAGKISPQSAAERTNYGRPPLTRSTVYRNSLSDSDEEFMRNLSPISSPDIPPIRDISELEPAKREPEKKKVKLQRSDSRGRTPSPILRRRTPSPPLKRWRPESFETESIGSIQDETDANVSVHDETISEETFGGMRVMGMEDLAIATPASPEQEVRFDPTPRIIPASYDTTASTDSHDERKKRVNADKSKSIFNTYHVQTIEDLLGDQDQNLDSTSEILTQRTLSEIRTKMSTPLSARLSRSFSAQSADTYSQDFDSYSEADSYMSKPQGSHTETIHTERTMSPDSRRADWRRRRTFSKSASYTDDFESMQTDSDVDDLSDSVSYSESYTSFSESRTLTRTATPIKKTTKKGKVDSRDVGIQAEDIMGYHWRKDAGSAVLGPSLGLQYVDPSPIASHVISSDAVEALTSYSPSVLLLNDMLRSQLQITQTFLRNSRQMYNSYVGSIGSQFNYTTIEDTNEFLKQHRRPRLTFEEALRQVKEEMGMENK